MSSLAALAASSTIVADTGDAAEIARLKPQDATTNPSLLLKASKQPEYAGLIEASVVYAATHGGDAEEQLSLALDTLFVAFGAEILKSIPGVVSTEVDARLSFDTEATVMRARRIIDLYEKLHGIGRDRVLIKIASTYEGIEAARILEKEGIRCNLTLLFSLVQAAACAEAGAYLISPFVGRILDWYKKATGKKGYPSEEDPGVLSVRAIYAYYKQHGYRTVIMGASFRNVGEITALAGCDRLTIAPKFLKALGKSKAPVPQKLSPAGPHPAMPKLPVDERSFRFALNEDAMATEKLAEGIRRFSADIVKLEAHVATLLAGRPRARL
jgi:transaldolase